PREKAKIKILSNDRIHLVNHLDQLRDCCGCDKKFCFAACGRSSLMRAQKGSARRHAHATP
ncbi:MAG: hypothetical protein WBD23_09250, partial [Candidatus Acidiferrales bacterium]